MCSPSAPSAPEPEHRPPRFLLSRAQHQRLRDKQGGSPTLAQPAPPAPHYTGFGSGAMNKAVTRQRQANAGLGL